MLTQVYSPTSENLEEEVERLHRQLKASLKSTQNQEVNVILDDFNAKVGKVVVINTVEQFGLT